MAGSKEIKKRIGSVKNTRKITRTMEMVSTAKSKKLVDRVHAAQPYANKLREVMINLAQAGGVADSPFLKSVEDPRKIALLVMTANRGLCGGYNSNTLKLARARFEILKSEDREVDLYVVGKKGLAYFKFINFEVKDSWIEIDDGLQYAQAEKLALFFMNSFVEGTYEKIEVVSTLYKSAGSQVPDITQYLPIGMENLDSAAAEDETRTAGMIDYDPGPSVLIERILPLAIKTNMYRLLMEAVTSEQIYRRIAMKNATDAAGDMLKDLTRKYNRVRQASITQELSEIVAGADAI